MKAGESGLVGNRSHPMGAFNQAGSDHLGLPGRVDDRLDVGNHLRRAGGGGALVEIVGGRKLLRAHGRQTFRIRWRDYWSYCRSLWPPWRIFRWSNRAIACPYHHTYTYRSGATEGYRTALADGNSGKFATWWRVVDFAGDVPPAAHFGIHKVVPRGRRGFTRGSNTTPRVDLTVAHR